jgi:hypothetical protein
MADDGTVQYLYRTIISRCKCLIISWALSMYRAGLHRIIISRHRLDLIHLLSVKRPNTEWPNAERLNIEWPKTKRPNAKRLNVEWSFEAKSVNSSTELRTNQLEDDDWTSSLTAFKFGVRSFDIGSDSTLGHSVLGPCSTLGPIWHSVIRCSVIRCSVIRCWVFRRSVIRCSVFRRSVFRRSVCESLILFLISLSL